MNICDKVVVKNQDFIQGNLYIVRARPEVVYINISKTMMIKLSNGNSVSCTDPFLWADVTDLYCLQKVK